VIDGNAMLRKFELGLLPVGRAASYQNGKYIIAHPAVQDPVHDPAHCFAICIVDGMVMKVDECERRIMSMESIVNIIGEGNMRVYKIVPANEVEIFLEYVQPATFTDINLIIAA
jgi:hypothetical protein